jgi:hypothetical protein
VGSFLQRKNKLVSVPALDVNDDTDTYNDLSDVADDNDTSNDVDVDDTGTVDVALYDVDVDDK